jgi:hypothetical protein
VRPIVIIESPYAGDLPRNQEYLRRALLHSWEAGECPFASHAIFPLFLDDTLDSERAAGIELGYRFWPFADCIAFYVDYGMSPGMQAAFNKANKHNFCFETRTIGKNSP